jgi:sterol desaturase/sphingolipid hydroxylase (fatty acid hydroxylase superfamily)
MSETVGLILESIGQSALGGMPLLAGFGICFAALTHIWACNAGSPWWRKRELVTDLCYWFMFPLVARYMRIGLVIAGSILLFRIDNPDELIAFFTDGHGPLSRAPMWVQAVVYLVGWDVISYFTHRFFHSDAMWKFHAIHHSSKELDWISAPRFHPINIMLGSVFAEVALIIAGISPNAILLLAPLNIAHSAFVHANLNWTLGPMRYVIAGPIFHRWHHTSPDRGGSKNFAPTFPILDIIFGTFYLPDNELPDNYGVDEEGFPEGFGGQMLYPFKR